MMNKRMMVLSAVSLASAVAMIGCAPKSDSEGETAEGIGERTGAALDTAAGETVDAGAAVADKTADAAKATAAKTREMTDKAVQKTGEALEKTGAGMQDDSTTEK